jgi:polar amino acid transport system substrate-binding protein
MEIAEPFSKLDENNRPQGLAVDLIVAMLEKVNSKAEFYICPFARCLRLVEQGDADLVFGLIKTPERMESLAFIEPAFIQSMTKVSFYQLESSTVEISQTSDLISLNIGVQRGALHFDEFDNNKSISKIEVTNIADLIGMLQKKRIDAFVMPQLSAEQYLDKYDKKNEIKRSKLFYQKEQGGYIALSKKSNYLSELPKLSAALQELKKTGALKQILKNYDLEQ